MTPTETCKATVDLEIINAAKNEFISMNESRRKEFGELLGRRIIEVMESKLNQLEYIEKWSHSSLVRKEG